MARHSSERLEARLLKRWRKNKVLKLPSWWLQLSPGMPGRFWNSVEKERITAGVERWDTSGMTYIINRLKGVRHERH